jgi:hypothetical protein
MGGSSSLAINKLNKSEADIVSLMLPVYYIDSELTQDEHRTAFDSWDEILNDTAPDYLSSKRNKEISYPSCIAYFYDLFYNRFFDIHPMAKDLFKKGIKSQGKMLVKLISIALMEVKDSEKFQNTFQRLAEMHNRIGVKAAECFFNLFILITL